MKNKAKTYYPAEGATFIQDNELIYSEKILAVKREGIGQDPTYTSRGFSYSESEGKISWVTPSGPGETVRVWFTPGTGPVITCTPVTGTPVFPNAVIGVSYYYAYTFTGTTPFILTVGYKPPWMTVTLAGAQVIFSGTPDDPDGTIEFTLTNCEGGGVLNIVDEFLVYLPASVNVIISNATYPGAQILGVSGFSYTIDAGLFPINNGQTLSAVLDAGFSTAISVLVGGITFACSLVLKKNGVTQETIAVTTFGTKTFAPVAFLTTDDLEINLTL